MHKFKLQEEVMLPVAVHKEITGIILGVWIVDKGIQYLIRYFWEGKPQEVYFYEWELRKI